MSFIPALSAEKMRKITIVVNNTGVTPYEALEALAAEEWSVDDAVYNIRAERKAGMRK